MVLQVPTGPTSAILYAEELLADLKENPGSRSERITAARGADPASLRSVMKGLLEAAWVRAEGERRATAYSLVGG